MKSEIAVRKPAIKFFQSEQPKHVTSTIATAIMNGIRKGIPSRAIVHVLNCPDVCQKKDVHAKEDSITAR